MATWEGNGSLRDGLETDDTKVGIIAYSSCTCLDLLESTLGDIVRSLNILVFFPHVILSVHIHF